MGIKNLPNNLVCSVLLEHGWLKYNNGKYEEAMEYFLEAAMKGSANAFNAVAIYYKEGHGYEKNPQRFPFRKSRFTKNELFHLSFKMVK